MRERVNIEIFLLLLHLKAKNEKFENVQGVNFHRCSKMMSEKAYCTTNYPRYSSFIDDHTAVTADDDDDDDVRCRGEFPRKHRDETLRHARSYSYDGENDAVAAAVKKKKAAVISLFYFRYCHHLLPPPSYPMAH